MTVRVRHNSTTGAAANPNVLVDGPKWDADHIVTGLENVDNTSDATKNAATATLTNKTLAAPTVTGLMTLSGGQIAFPATQNPSSDPNTLDDYEEGAFTPVLTFGTPGDLSVTYSQQVGAYEKAGKFVFCQFTIITSAFTFTTASGNLTITGLPFTSGAAGNGRAPLVWGGVTKAGFTNLVATVLTSNTSMVINASGSGVAAGAVTATDTPSGGTVVMAGNASYLASA